MSVSFCLRVKQSGVDSYGDNLEARRLQAQKNKGVVIELVIVNDQGLDTAIISAIPVVERSSRERCAAPLGSRCVAPPDLGSP